MSNSATMAASCVFQNQPAAQAPCSMPASPAFAQLPLLVQRLSKRAGKPPQVPRLPQGSARADYFDGAPRSYDGGRTRSMNEKRT
ncbi:MAG: hypothetical protein KF708_23625 [Pirellulales bacterium]|nr:hypothetical protein [Pirellulales bacterium]